ncbi:MAG: aldose 1-epimerase family protein [Bacteroidia bacterium]|nr:aldose 1-epimerase family protein [Bacteroidia bacterium]
MLILENDQISLRVAPSGAEMQSLILRETGQEYLWQADPAWWPRRAPVLFPIVGRLREDQYQHGGQPYRLTQHGFARDRVFESLPGGWFRLVSDAQTRAVYPFEFELRIGYALEASTVTVTYEVHNTGEGILPFSIGAHPGFTCPLPPDTDMQAYDLVFSQPETAARHLLTGGLRNGDTEPVLTASDRIPLSPAMFDRDALVFQELASDWTEIRSRHTGHYVRVSLTGFPYLGIWTKPGAPFVCIEPWQGVADATEATGELTEKEGIRLLMPGQVHTCGFTITIG